LIPTNSPNDPAALRQIVVGLLGEAAERERKLRQMQHWVEHLLQVRYGPWLERVSLPRGYATVEPTGHCQWARLL